MRSMFQLVITQCILAAMTIMYFRMSQKKYIFEMLTADPLNVCEIMFNIHCTKIRSFGGRLEVAHRLQTFSHALTLRGLMTSMTMLLFARFMQQIPLYELLGAK